MASSRCIALLKRPNGQDFPRYVM